MMITARVLRFILVFSLIESVGPGSHLALAQAKDVITVRVVDAKDYRPLEGARVFVQDEAGRELVASSTNNVGIVRLPAIAASQRPKYVLVEHPAYFITGMRFQPGLLEYYLLSTIFTVR